MKRSDFILYGVFLIIICLLSWENINLKGKIKKDIVVDSSLIKLERDYFGKVVPEFSLPSVTEGEKFIFTPNSSDLYYLVIFFTPRDCQDCFKEIPFWKQIESEFKNRLRVLAIGTADSMNMFQYWVEKNNISILTLYDEEEQLFEKVGLKDSFFTPAKLLINSRGIILHISPSFHQNQKLQQQYMNLLDKILPLK